MGFNHHGSRTYQLLSLSLSRVAVMTVGKTRDAEPRDRVKTTRILQMSSRTTQDDAEDADESKTTRYEEVMLTALTT